MIRLRKLPKPQILVDNAKKWRSEYKRYLQKAPGIPKAAATRYSHVEVKSQLVAETFGKCAYCESKMHHVTASHIEHILPKSRRPGLVVAWNNLTLACPVCNKNKLEYYEPTAPLLNPYLQHPPAHVLFAGPIAVHRPGSDLGLRTIARLGLSRTDLVEKRLDRLLEIQRLLDLEAKQTNTSDAQLLQAEIERQTQEEAEYSAAVRAFVRSQRGDRPQPLS